jgi:hypothetical protein
LLQLEHVGIALSHLIFFRTQAWQLKRIVVKSALEPFCTSTEGALVGAGAIGTRCEAAVLLDSMTWMLNVPQDAGEIYMNAQLLIGRAKHVGISETRDATVHRG